MLLRLALLMMLGATAFGATAAPRGDCRLCPPSKEAADSARDSEKPMAITVEAGLSFDQIILSGETGGSALIRPDGSTQVDGGIAALSARAMVGRAEITGEPGRLVTVGLPRRIELYSASGGRVVIDSIVSDLPPAPRLDSRGLLRFRFGGRIQVSGDSEGTYRGEIPVTADYL